MIPKSPRTSKLFLIKTFTREESTSMTRFTKWLIQTLQLSLRKRFLQDSWVEKASPQNPKIKWSNESSWNLKKSFSKQKKAFYIPQVNWCFIIKWILMIKWVTTNNQPIIYYQNDSLETSYKEESASSQSFLKSFLRSNHKNNESKTRSKLESLVMICSLNNNIGNTQQTIPTTTRQLTTNILTTPLMTHTTKCTIWVFNWICLLKTSALK